MDPHQDIILEHEEIPTDAEFTGDAVENSTSETSENNNQGNNNDSATDKTSDELAALKDKYLRLLAEFENAKRRNAREKVELMRTASKDLIVEVLPVLDDFERAFKAQNTDPKGFELIYNKLKHILDQKGLKVMQTIGEEFNPDLHDAITEIPAPNQEMQGKVVDELERGYYLHEKIIRYAKVIVGK
jgi:molecular chaperone GrpE